MRPNPFNSRTVVQYVLFEPGPIELTVYDARGRRVRQLARGAQAPGRHSVPWDALTDAGITVESGVYFIRLRLDDQVFTRRVILLK